MCGIAGIINLDGTPVDKAHLLVMNRTMAHRGPDGEGIFLAGPVGLAHRRLAIIDPQGGHQPFVNEAAGLALTYNGEIYNYKEIRASLSATTGFHTECDTEVLLAAWSHLGTRCLELFRGMFAFAVFDQKNHQIHLVRDRAGIKPLYYFHDDTRFLFASELSALMAPGLIPKRLERQALAAYFNLQYVPTPTCIYQGVKKLAPGCLLTLDMGSGRVEESCYWHLTPLVRYSDEEEALSVLSGLLSETLDIYIRSDAPYGTFLSGGIDSGTVTGLVAQRLTRPVKSFTIGYHEGAHSELREARQAAEIIGSDHHELIVTAQMLTDTIDKLAHHFGEPFADSSAVPTFFVSQLAASQVKMVLSGDGGDELFAGYTTYRLLWDYLHDPFRRFVKAPCYRLLSRVAPFASIRNTARNRGRHLTGIYEANMHYFSRPLVARLMGETLPLPIFHDTTATPDPITAFLYQDFRTYLMDAVLTKVDRMSMANSLEVRVPLLDHRLVEFAFSLPLSMKMGVENGQLNSKRILKRFSERIFPKGFFDRPKRGFGIPLNEWLRGPLSERLRDLTEERNHPLYDHLEAAVVQRLVGQFLGGQLDAGGTMWGLLMFRLWLDGPGRDAG